MSNQTGSPTILVIDNSEVVLSATRDVLETAGFRVLTHARPSGCVALILQERPDLVLLEVNIGGDTIAKLFGKAQPNGHTVVLLYSGLAVSALEAKVASSGAHGFIRKTPDGVDFLRQVNAWLKRSGFSSANLRAASRIEPENEQAPRQSGARRIGSDDAPSASVLEAASPVRTASSSDTRRSSGSLALDLPVVLFIDDDMSALSELRREVQSESYTAAFALSGAQAVRQILSACPPDLVVCDVVMPAPNGPEVYRQVVAADARWRTRFVFVTEPTYDPSVSAFLSSFDGVVLEKPIRGEALRKRIRRSLAEFDSRARTASGG